MTLKPLKYILGLLLLTTSCTPIPETQKDMKYTSAITFLYYEDFSYGIYVMENILQLELVMEQDVARVYKVNQKAFLGIVKQRQNDETSGNTLFSLTTKDVETEYKRVSQLKVYDLTDLKYFKSIPLKSFFFDDQEGHKFEIQQFINKDDAKRF